MNGDGVVMMVGIAASLFLALRALRSHQLNLSKTVQMAVIWILIIAALAFLIQRFAA